uniref:Mutator family transposase n=1 Tax=Candidatus Kentrum eta TaxID=2126337 RepID=A0A450VLC3_9GAMM|nr:MAG: Transposase, Mutator family [Candidatus Kentron sp. H]VFK05602.1 MAG: Transposase, Mutator family [Candidatus Kentron sp. H]VFK08831.1 MAG: Transposase, Mutator family [Candidatus Kentron sp. H]
MVDWTLPSKPVTLFFFKSGVGFSLNYYNIGLKGSPEAIETVYPQTRVQLCIVHQVRHSLRYVSWKQRKEVAANLHRSNPVGS